ncbi:MAG: monooxygenase, partial [Myxococcota bacterium]|nr:monooxygenase [Myxococcota bacterium]
MRVSIPCLLLLTACADRTDAAGIEHDSASAAGPVPTWHGEVAPILSHSCDGCHAPGGVGTPTWSTPAEAASWAPAIADAVADRRMPPWQAVDGCNSYENDFSLDEEAVRTIVGWADGGAPLGDPSAASDLEDPFASPQLERTDLELLMPQPYTPSPYQGTDDYRCFLLEWPYEEEVWVTGYEVLPGDMKTVHHVIPFIIEPEISDTYIALDEADTGAGYTCYGGPGGGLTALATMRWLGSWAPGSGASLMPEGTGIKVRPGSLIAYQVHYNLAATETPGADLSGLALQVETERQGWADIQPFTDVAWVAGAGMEIPPRSDGVEH